MAREDFAIVDQKPIGRGQFGTVFRARRRSDGCVAAFKLILHDGENGGGTIAAERHGAVREHRCCHRGKPAGRCGPGRTWRVPRAGRPE